MRTYTEAKAIALAVTSGFEGTGYERLENAGDGEGWTFGLLGFSFGSGELQRVITRMRAVDKDAFTECCTVYLPHSAKVENISYNLQHAAGLTPREAVEWCANRERHGVPMGYWVEIFRNLGRVPAFQSIQRSFAEPKFDRAADYCIDYDVCTVRGLCLFFDGVTQQGGLNALTQARLLLGGVRRKAAQQKLLAIAQAMSDQARDTYREAVLARRQAIVYGYGTVGGKVFDGPRLGVSDEPVSMPCWRH